MESNVQNAVARYADVVYRLAYAQTHNKNDADDVFQEVFLRYVRYAPDFNDEEHRKAWLLRVTVNCSKKLLGSAWYRRTVPLEDRYAIEEPEACALDGILDRLAPKYRSVIHLYYYEGYSVEQVAQILARKPSTVRAQMTRAREKLKKLLKGEDFDV